MRALPGVFVMRLLARPYRSCVADRRIYYDHDFALKICVVTSTRPRAGTTRVANGQALVICPPSPWRSDEERDGLCSLEGENS